MTAQDKRTVALKLRAVAAMAESLAEDVENHKLWEGDLARRIGAITEELNGARNAAKDDR